MTFLAKVLLDLEIMGIPAEEHYDPEGMHLFQLHVQADDNPMMVYSPQNPNNALITISIIYSPAILANLNNTERIKLKTRLKKVGSKLVLRYELGLSKNTLFFSTGFILDARNYCTQTMKLGIDRLMEAYDEVMAEMMVITQAL